MLAMTDYMLAFTLTPTVCFQVDCYDYHVSGSHDLIGSFKATLAEMQLGTHVCPVRISLCL